MKEKWKVITIPWSLMEKRLNELSEDGWGIFQIFPTDGNFQYRILLSKIVDDETI